MDERIRSIIVPIPKGEGGDEIYQEVKERLDRLINEDYFEALNKSGGGVKHGFLGNESTVQEYKFTFYGIPKTLEDLIFSDAERLLQRHQLI